jgi:Holliday junction resolvase
MNTPKPPLEKKVVNKVLMTIRSRGGFAIKLHGSPFMALGLPDIIACYRGHFLAFEVKRGEEYEATPIQEFQLGRIRKAGGVALRIHSVEPVLDELDRIDKL